MLQNLGKNPFNSVLKKILNFSLKLKKKKWYYAEFGKKNASSEFFWTEIELESSLLWFTMHFDFFLQSTSLTFNKLQNWTTLFRQ